MWPCADRCVEIVKSIVKKEEQDQKQKKIHQAEVDFRKTLEKLWPLKKENDIIAQPME